MIMPSEAMSGAQLWSAPAHLILSSVLISSTTSSTVLGYLNCSVSASTVSAQFETVLLLETNEIRLLDDETLFFPSIVLNSNAKRERVKIMTLDCESRRHFPCSANRKDVAQKICETLNPNPRLVALGYPKTLQPTWKNFGSHHGQKLWFALPKVVWKTLLFYWGKTWRKKFVRRSTATLTCDQYASLYLGWERHFNLRGKTGEIT